jgi:hypothetical protein
MPDGQRTHFARTNRLKELRSVLITLKRQDDYLTVAEKHEIAEKMIEVEGGGQLDPSSDIAQWSREWNVID